MLSAQDHERAKDDAKTSNEFARAGAQAAILINGGAATAILAVFSNSLKEGMRAILPILPPALLTYAFGVFLAAIAFPTGSQAIEIFMRYHEGEKSIGKKGERYWHVTITLISLSILCFFVASAYIAYSLQSIVRQNSTIQPHQTSASTLPTVHP